MRLDGVMEAGTMRGRETWEVSKVGETEAHSCTSWSRECQPSRFLLQVVGYSWYTQRGHTWALASGSSWNLIMLFVSHYDPGGSSSLSLSL